MANIQNRKMSWKERNRAASANGKNSAGKASSAKAPRSRGQKKNPQGFVLRIPMYVMLLIAVWAFLYFFYGDLMQVAEQRSFFAWDSTAMSYWNCQSLGWLYITGRFMLLSCKWPVLGTLIIALLLTLSAYALNYALSLKGWGRVVGLLVPSLYFGWMVYERLNVIYLREVSWIMTNPLLLAVGFGLFALVVKFVSKRKGCVFKDFRKQPDETPATLLKLYGVILLQFLLSVGVSVFYTQNDRLTCSMECKMYEQDWEGMAEIAKGARQPSRTVTGYYALALNNMGTLTSEIFNLPYQYENAHLTRDHGDFDGGLDFIVIDCNYYAGLVMPAYHEGIEQNVIYGPSINRLKRMTQCALILGETSLAEKYLAILDKVPFEGAFVEKYKEYITNPGLVEQDAEFNSVKELSPVNDSFEQNYKEPLFLGYNVSLVEGRTMRALNNSLLACLYSKDMNSFGMRIPTLLQSKTMLPKYYEEALVVMNIKNLAALKPLNLQPSTLKTFQEFMGDCFQGDGEKITKGMDRDTKNRISKKKASEWADKYRGTYEYYYYFQNVPDENYILPGEDKKGGVN